MFRVVAIAGLVAIALAAAGCDPPTSAQSGTRKSKPDTGAKRGDSPSAKAQAKTASPTAQNQPKPKPPQPAYRFGSPLLVKTVAIGSAPAAKEADADELALVSAAEIIEQKLAELDPPVNYRPTVNEVRNEFVRHDTRAVRPPDAAERDQLEEYRIDPNRVYVVYEVEVTADQVRELRSRDRVADTVRLLGVLTAAALAGFLFLRLDERTKGYLTRWLALGALALASGAAVGLYLL